MNRRRVLILTILLTLALIFYKAQKPAIDLALKSSTEAIIGARMDEKPPVGPLPKNVRPTHYMLALTIAPERDAFEGRAEIRINLDKESRYIWLHGNGLEVSEVFATDFKGRRIAGRYTQVEKSGVARVDLASALPAGAATLTFSYKASFNTALDGLYKVVEDGRSYAFTQFEATSARLAFPGFDEPAFKVPFDITLTVPQHEVAVSNTPIVEETRVEGGLKRLKFATTRPLPTYLIAFVVGDLDVVEWDAIPASGVRDHPIPLRGITAKGKGDQIRFALSHTADILATEESYFGTPYPYEKLDIIAAPDFAAGAMENAGAIIYREQLMLLDDKASLGRKRYSLLVHAHELSHQWFGDLVTPAWWDNLWLNESFATWMENKALAMWRPHEQFERETARGGIGAMAMDQLVSARQIEQPITSSHDIESAFDSITYEKGGAVLAMFESYLGEEVFRKGIQLHLKRHAHGVATAQDFLQSLADASGNPDIVNAFQSFLRQPGVPLVGIDWSCPERQGATVNVTLTQSRYVPLGSSGQPGKIWQIPVCLAYWAEGARMQDCMLLTKPVQTVALKAKSCPSAIMPNANGAGYYRWTMPADKWKALLAAYPALNATENLSLEDSLWAAVRSGATPLETYLDAVPKLIISRAFDVAVSPMESLNIISDTLLTGEVRALAKARFAALYQPKFKELGFNPDTPLDARDPLTATMLRRPVVAYLALDVKDAAVRTGLLELGKAYIGFGDDNELHLDKVNPNIASIALAVAVQELGSPYADALIARFEKSTNAILRDDILRALVQADDPVVIEKAEAMILSPKIRDNEVLLLLFGLAAQEETRAAAWVWFTKNFDAVLPRVSTAQQRYLPRMGRGFCDAARREEVRSFFEKRAQDLEGGPRELANALEEIDLCIAFKAQHQSAAEAYFAQ